MVSQHWLNLNSICKEVKIIMERLIAQGQILLEKDFVELTPVYY